jgi:putative ATPase
LRSRSQLYRLRPLGEDDLVKLLDLALTDVDRGLGGLRVEVTESARAALIGYANGDGRRLLASLELCVLGAETTPGAPVHITEDEVRRHLQYGGRRYDRGGDEHYDTISAFIKSVRGSDPDAAVYWLAKMIEGGEDPRFIARRLVILAAEDVGLADPGALSLANAAFSAVERIGMPEAQLILSEATLYLATAPKSNSATVAISEATREIRERPTMEVPLHLRDAHYQGAGSLGHGVGYLYPHDYPGHWVPQNYLPETRSFYHPSDQGFEPTIAERIAQRISNGSRERIEPVNEPTTAPDDTGPIDNTSPR